VGPTAPRQHLLPHPKSTIFGQSLCQSCCCSCFVCLPVHSELAWPATVTAPRAHCRSRPPRPLATRAAQSRQPRLTPTAADNPGSSNCSARRGLFCCCCCCSCVTTRSMLADDAARTSRTSTAAARDGGCPPARDFLTKEVQIDDHLFTLHCCRSTFLRPTSVTCSLSLQSVDEGGIWDPRLDLLDVLRCICQCSHAL
jgi:hypothetical protein